MTGWQPCFRSALNGPHHFPAHGPGYPYQHHPRTAADGLAVFGRTPRNGYLFDMSSGNAEDLIASATLTAAGADAPYDYRTPTPYAGRFGVAPAAAGDRNYFLNSAATFDPSIGNAWLIHARFSTMGADTDYLLAQSSSQHLLLSISNIGRITLSKKDDAATSTSIVTAGADHSDADTWIWAAVDPTSDLLRLSTRLSVVTADISAHGAHAARQQYVWGLSTVGAPGGDLLAAYFFEGAEAEGDPADTMDRLRYVGGN